MTSTQATYAAILSMDGPPPSRIARIRTRLSTTHTVGSSASARANKQPLNPGLHLVASAAEPARRFHPGDVAYWVACLGGACLLLVCATR